MPPETFSKDYVVLFDRCSLDSAKELRLLRLQLSLNLLCQLSHPRALDFLLFFQPLVLLFHLCFKVSILRFKHLFTSLQSLPQLHDFLVELIVLSLEGVQFFFLELASELGHDALVVEIVLALVVVASSIAVTFLNLAFNDLAVDFLNRALPNCLKRISVRFDSYVIAGFVFETIVFDHFVHLMVVGLVVLSLWTVKLVGNSARHRLLGLGMVAQLGRRQQDL